MHKFLKMPPMKQHRITKLVKIVIGLSVINCCLASPHTSPYSLQAAVDALHHREAQFAFDHGQLNREPGDWNEESEAANHRRLNSILSNYLTREDERDEAPGYEFSSGYVPVFDLRDDEYRSFRPEAKKRSIFRERDELPRSVFRERSQSDNDRELSDDFLQEMDKEQNAMRERQYTELLRRLWQKYKTSDEELEREILEREHEHDPENGDDDDILDDDFYKKKRTSYTPMVGYPSPMLVGYYGNSNVAYDKKKRDYPVLPWLPAKKKRFPIVLTKRSSPPIDHKKIDSNAAKIEPTTLPDSKKKAIEPTSKSNQELNPTVTTDKNLQTKKIPDEEEKKKKNLSTKKAIADDEKKKSTLKKSDKKPVEEKSGLKSTVIVKKRDIHDEMLKDFETLWKRGQASQKKKRQLGEDCEDEEDCGEVEHDVYEDHSEEEDDEEEESEEEEENEDDNRRKRKRAVHKRKRANMEEIREEQIIPGDRVDKKRSIDWSKTWGLDRKKKSAQAYPLDFYKTYDSDRRRKFETEKLDNMDQKLKQIEDVLLDETVKYTGAHEGIVEPKEIAKLKDHVVSRLATAYSLEKMRQQLDKLKDTVESEKHLKQNEIATGDEKEKKEKRVAVKKEKAEFKHDDHKPDDEPKKVDHEMPPNTIHDSDEDKKKKKKRNDDALNEISDILSYEDSCPILDTLEKRCRGVDVLTGDVHQNLLPACGVHQLCYLCGTSQSECDFQFLTDAEAICGHHTSCLASAKSALMVLRGFSSPLLGPHECARSSCLYQALKDIGL